MTKTWNINGVASPTYTTSYAGGNLSCNLAIPLTRVSQLGVRPIRITGVSLYISGNGGTRSVKMGVGSARTSAFNVSNAGSATLVPSKAILYNALNTAVTTSTSVGIYNPSGSFHFGRASNPGNSITGFSGGSGQTLVGELEYIEVPSAPFGVTLTPSGGDIIANWSVPADDGGGALTGYDIEYADNEAFTTSTVTTSVTNTKTFTPPPGGSVFVRIAAKNPLYAFSEKPMSPWSATATTDVGVGGFRWDGTSEVPLTVAMRWDGTAEVPVTLGMRWDGTTEVPLG